MEGRTRGRPKKDDAKSEKFLLKMGKDEMAELEYLSYMSGKSKSEILRRALRSYYGTAVRRY